MYTSEDIQSENKLGRENIFQLKTAIWFVLLVLINWKTPPKKRKDVVKDFEQLPSSQENTNRTRHTENVFMHVHKLTSANLHWVMTGF